jgi:hypothetical protein
MEKVTDSATIFESDLLNKFDKFLLDGSTQNESEILNVAYSILKTNSLLWDQEDLARRTNVSPGEVVQNKRSIDKLNQTRNDLIETLDSIVYDHFAINNFPDTAFRNCETMGSLIDRISIITLKIHHTNLLSLSGEEIHRGIRIEERKDILADQRRDLLESLLWLLEGLNKRTVMFKRYRQFKMYNDPALNPHLRNEGLKSAQRS